MFYIAIIQNYIVDSEDDLHLEITLNLHIVVTLIKLVFLKLKLSTTIMYS